MKWSVSNEDIDNSILSIERTFFNHIERYHAICNFCKDKLFHYRQELIKQGFTDQNEEILFFKSEKPFLLGNYIYYETLLAISLEYPNGNPPNSYLQRKISQANRFLALHADFVLYTTLKKDNLDELYFLRKNRHLLTPKNIYLIELDPEFCTSHDLLAANIFANQQLQKTLDKMMSATPSKEDHAHSPILHWTASKVALTELGFGLYYSGAINNGHTPLKSIMDALEQITGVSLSDYHHTSIRFRNRNNPTKFLDEIKDALNDWIAKLDD